MANEEQIRVSLINTQDGKIRWITDKRTLNELLVEDNWKIFPNPEKNYYYEHDGNLNKKLGQEAKLVSAITNLGEEEILEVILI